MMNPIKIFLFILFAVLLGACHSSVNPPEPRGEYIYVQILMPQDSTTLSRGVPEEGEDGKLENQINNVVLFFVKENTSGVKTIYNKINVANLDINPIPVPVATVEANFTAGDRLWLYVVANFTDHADIDNNTPLSTLESKLTNERHDINNSDNTPFLMEAHNSEAIEYDISRYPFTAISLRRIAVKMRFSRFSFEQPLNADGTPDTRWQAWQPAALQIQLRHFPSQGRVVESTTPLPVEQLLFQDKVYSPSTPADGTVLYTRENPLHTRGEESYILLNLPYTNNAGAAQSGNYYKVTLPKGAILRNHLYDIAITIRELGSPNPIEAKSLEGQIAIKDWTTEETNVSVANDHVQVSKTNSEFTGTVYDFKLRTNKLPRITSTRDDGTVSTVPVPPSYSLNSENKISVTTEVIASFTPERRFTVSVISGILEKKIYFTQHPNSNFRESVPGTPEYNIIETRVGEGDVYIVRPTVSDGVTEATEEENKKISPVFEIYHHAGEVLGGASHHEPADIAKNLNIEGRTGWRVPTIAELQLIRRAMQAEYVPGTPNSTRPPYASVLPNTSYWSARQDGSLSSDHVIVNLTDGTTSVGGHNTRAYLMCVRDITE